MISNIYGQRKRNNEFILGVGFNTIVDSGENINEIINFSESYHFSRPFKLSLEKKLNLNHGIEIRGTSNLFKTTKKFNSGFPTEDIDFYSLDVSFKYHFIKGKNCCFFEPKALTSYALAGLGRSWFNNLQDNTFHIGGGLNYQFYKELKLNIQTIAKIGITGDVSNNYLKIEFGILIPLKKTINILTKNNL